MFERRANVHPPHRDTCQWIFDLEEYHVWKAGPCGLLWIKGKPGSGKSTIMRKLQRPVFAERDSTRELCLDFFFTARGTALQKTSLGMLRSLLSQLYRRDSSIRRPIKMLYIEKDDSFANTRYTWKWQEPELQELFLEAVLAVAQRRQTVILIDALNEAGETSARGIVRYVHAINDRAAEQSAKIKVCMSCRHYPVLSHVRAAEIHVENYNGQDIASYIRDNIRIDHDTTEVVGNVNEWRQLIRSLIETAKGVFQWACLVVPMVEQSILDGESPDQVRRWLTKVPQDLGQVYEHILTKVINRKNKSKSLQLFQWLCLAERPLSMMGLECAIDTDDAPRNIPRGKLLAEAGTVESSAGMQAKFRAWSGGLAEVVDNGKDRPKMVQTVHQSVTDFLMNQGLEILIELNLQDEPDVEQATNFSKQDIISRSHSDLYWTCLRHATRYKNQELQAHESSPTSNELAHDRERPPSFEDRYPFLTYAAENAVAHGKKAAEHRARNLRVEAELLSDASFVWAAALEALERKGERKYGSRSTPLIIAAAANWTDLTQELLNTGCDPNSIDKHGWTALHFAVLEGNLEIFTMLVRAGARTQSTSNGPSLAFLAASRGREAVFLWLLIEGQNRPDFPDIIVNALFGAAANGHTHIVRICIEAGVDVNAQGGYDGNALNAAARFGRRATIQFLLDAGADVNGPGGKHGSALQIAAKYGHAGVLQALLEAGAFVDAQEGLSGTALYEASLQGRVDLVRLLIDAGADVNKQQRGYDTPLDVCLAAQDSTEAPELWEVARLLRRAGAVVTSKTVAGFRR